MNEVEANNQTETISRQPVNRVKKIGSIALILLLVNAVTAWIVMFSGGKDNISKIEETGKFVLSLAASTSNSSNTSLIT